MHVEGVRQGSGNVRPGTAGAHTQAEGHLTSGRTHGGTNP
nr:MAG TPA: hypothetical protein [Inoviridae sp.]